ncbi:Hypothetical predicted protein [Lecanosticta acicola]|uniref:Uncharacterized protein n=1 Tax=Lecanosticta acicola TaxID=111012 RepID=A0AAI8YZK0_9PEZI|nr:Hypothetical predicted protein [Lecanosticta acicola]
MGIAMKRKADDTFNNASPGRRLKAPCFNVPSQWPPSYEDNTGMQDMMTSPPPTRRQSLFEGDWDINGNSVSTASENSGNGRSGSGMDVDMGSPGQLCNRSPIQGLLSAQRIWRSLCSDESNVGRKAKREVCQLAWMEYLNEVAQSHPQRVVPREQYDAAQHEVERLRESVAHLTQELDDSKARISQLETQQSQHSFQQQHQQPVSTPTGRYEGAALATSFQQRHPPSQPQQAVFFTPHQYVPVP